MSEWSFIIGAYAVTWAGLIGYAAWLAVLSRRAAKRAGETARQP